MNRSGTTVIFVIVCAVVLIAAYGIGLGIRKIRFQGNKNESKAVVEPEKSDTKPETERIETGQVSDSVTDRPEPNLAAEEGEEVAEQSANIPKEESEDSRARMRGFGGRRPGGSDRFQNLSKEERARIEEQRRQMREKWESMSEEERQEYREMRGRIGPRGFSDEELGGRGEIADEVDSEQQQPDSEQQEVDSEQQQLDSEQQQVDSEQQENE